MREIKLSSGSGIENQESDIFTMTEGTFEYILQQNNDSALHRIESWKLCWNIAMGQSLLYGIDEFKSSHDGIDFSKFLSKTGLNIVDQLVKSATNHKSIYGTSDYMYRWTIRLIAHNGIQVSLGDREDYRNWSRDVSTRAYIWDFGFLKQNQKFVSVFCNWNKSWSDCEISLAAAHLYRFYKLSISELEDLYHTDNGGK